MAWIELTNLDDLNHGDTIRGICRSGFLIEGTIDVRNYMRDSTAVPFILLHDESDHEDIGHVCLADASPYYSNDIILEDCEVRK